MKYFETIKKLMKEFEDSNLSIRELQIEIQKITNKKIDEAYDFVSGLANHIKSLINNNPNLNSGQIANLISYP